jgi:hypothetical protein
MDNEYETGFVLSNGNVTFGLGRPQAATNSTARQNSVLKSMNNFLMVADTHMSIENE